MDAVRDFDMYALISRDAALEMRIRGLLGIQTTAFATWSAFISAAKGAELAVVALAQLDESDLDWLASIGEQRIVAPLVVITAFDRATAAWLAGLGGSLHVVWLDELQTMLPTTVAQLLKQSTRHYLTHFIHCGELSEWLRHALLMAIQDARPVHSVQQWAAQLSCSVATIDYHWRAELPAHDAGFTPKHFLDLLLVLRACELLRTHKPTSVAYLLGVHRRTLERVVSRAGFGSLSQLRGHARNAIAEMIAERIRSSKPQAVPAIAR